MAIEKKEIEFAKELDDVMVLFVELVKGIKNKGDYTALLDELIGAINGADDIDDEVKANLKASINTVTLRANDIAEVFYAKKEEPVEA